MGETETAEARAAVRNQQLNYRLLFGFSFISSNNIDRMKESHYYKC